MMLPLTILLRLYRGVLVRRERVPGAVFLVGTGLGRPCREALTDGRADLGDMGEEWSVGIAADKSLSDDGSTPYDIRCGCLDDGLTATEEASCWSPHTTCCTVLQ